MRNEIVRNPYLRPSDWLDAPALEVRLFRADGTEIGGVLFAPATPRPPHGHGRKPLPAPKLLRSRVGFGVRL